MIRVDRPVRLTELQVRLRPHLAALVPGLAAVALFLIWAIHDGGFDDDTWYWGALVSLALLGATTIALGPRRMRPPRLLLAAIGLLALYVAWSYASIAWAQAPGVALNGSNRALLYLLLFTLMALLPWTAEAAMAALLTFAIGVGAIAVVLLFRLASTDHVAGLFVGGRLATPTGYFNATAALFTMGALVALGLGARRELPGLLRGLLVALSGASLQLAVVVQSRGWLFTLPLVLVLGALVADDRLRVAVAAVIPAAMALIPIHRLLRIYDNAQGPGLNHAAAQAGRAGLVALGVGFFAATLLAWGDGLRPERRPNRGRRRAIGAVVLALAVAGGCAGVLAVTHGDPGGFLRRQWNGFSHEQAASTGSHFTDVGSGRYDFWRVALHAFATHPVGGLGQDNFADYYVKRRRTTEEPAWTHSLELRLLAHTGIVGFGLFAGFIACALIAAVRTRRRGPPLARAAAALALLPLLVWLLHGSVDWFWEMPALSGPALGFLGMTAALARAPEPATARTPAEPAAAPATVGAVATSGRSRRTGLGALAVVLAAAAVVVLALPYLSVREISIADDVSATNPGQAMADLKTAADLNPLNGDPGRIAGAIALRQGQLQVAQQRFRQSLDREPGGWFSWLGAGLAASGLGDRSAARRDFRTAYSINDQQPAVKAALTRVDSRHPLTSEQAFKLLIVVQ